MANEPERPIEKVLRAAAKKRGEEASAPFALHPVTRRILQGEVTQTFGKESQKTPAAQTGLARFWPRLVWAAAIMVALGVVIWVAIPKADKTPGTTTLALLKQAPNPSDNIQPTLEPAPPPPASPAPALASATETKTAGAKTEVTTPARDKDRAVTEDIPPAGAMLPPEGAPWKKEEPSRESNTRQFQEAEKSKSMLADRSPKNEPSPAAAPPSSYFDTKPAAAAPPVTVTAASASTPLTPKETAHSVSSVAQSDGSLKPAEANTFAYGRSTSPSEASAAPMPAAAPGAFAANAPATTNAVNMDRLAPGQHFVREETDLAAAEKKAESGLAGVAAKIPSSSTVLASFCVVQQGSELKIIDGDGSVYTGYVQPSTAATRRRSSGYGATFGAASSATPSRQAEEELPQVGAAAAARAPALPQAYTFSVKGTNLTLHKKVLFQGSLMTTANLDLLKAATNAATDFKALGGALPQNRALENARIMGKLSVGGGKETEINAAPAHP